MRIDQHNFDTPEEATAFLEGVTYVNDSAINAYVSEDDDTVVIVEDADGQEDEEGA